MRFSRASGILLHPTSLPGPYGIGDIGPIAQQFVDFLVSAGQSIWQVLPLGPTGYGDSPYQCFSAFAGNPLLISLEELARAGLLEWREIEAALMQVAGAFSPDFIDYGAVIYYRLPLLRQAFTRLQRTPESPLNAELHSFRAANARWLDDYALFMALKDHHGGASWHTWDAAIAARQPAALAHWRNELLDDIAFHQFTQYLFFKQWGALKSYANGRGVKIIGDAPIFVAYDSADVWANRQLFYLDDVGNPTVVAGVPPDYFSATGQRWGNPLYRWDVMAADNFSWWIERLRATLTLVDLLRVDHFRGFAAYWEIPAAEETAIKGRWVPAPGDDLFHALEKELGDIPIIAEDLGLITPDVEQLRDHFGLPGMKILQFAFDGDPDNNYLPHNYTTNCIVYPGTHDNNTTVGWFSELHDGQRAIIANYLGREPRDIAWDLLRLACMSVADIAIVPFQDVLRLNSDARMNTPGLLGGNWSWRFRADALNATVAGDLRTLTALYGRLPNKPAKVPPTYDMS
ncbi:4-alpha-glucanotransferase [Candidatus Gracilibacteria bacterium]|nr:4-alpha-glucanotransferase [Candidatus Gracilibacteria bacterium]